MENFAGRLGGVHGYLYRGGGLRREGARTGQNASYHAEFETPHWDLLLLLGILPRQAFEYISRSRRLLSGPAILGTARGETKLGEIRAAVTADDFLLYDGSVPARGKFITFEGLDGCGKSTQVEKLAVALRSRGLPVVVTREPGGTPAAEKIRQLLLDTKTAALAPMAELALMFAARAQHIDEVIAPALSEGRIVLCDRFTDSTEAYQGGGRKLGSQPVLELHRILCHGLQPDLTILMDSDVAISVARARRRNKADASKNADRGLDENRFEKESRAFFGQVHQAYLAIAERETERVFVVDARGIPQDTHRKILEAARRRLKLAAKSL
jgi:dTMP kinase